MNRVFLFVIFSFTFSYSFSQNNSRCYNGEYVSGVDTIYVELETRSVSSKRYTHVFSFAYYVRNKPEQGKNQILYCKKVDSVFYLAKDSTYFNLRKVQGNFVEMLYIKADNRSIKDEMWNINITDCSSMYYCPDTTVYLMPDKPWMDDMGRVIPCGYKEVIYDFVDKEPSFPGGWEAMNIFLKTNIKYPSELGTTCFEGTIYVQFVVEKDGTLTNFVMMRGLQPLMDAEAIRVIKTMPLWIPGMLSGKIVRARFIIPVKL